MTLARPYLSECPTVDDVVRMPQAEDLSKVFSIHVVQHLSPSLSLTRKSDPRCMYRQKQDIPFPPRPNQVFTHLTWCVFYPRFYYPSPLLCSHLSTPIAPPSLLSYLIHRFYGSSSGSEEPCT